MIRNFTFRSLFIAGFTILFSCGNALEEPGKNLGFNENLHGNWVAKAFDGELRERWHTGEDGGLWQEGYYIENNDTAYSAISRIEQVADKYILFSVIKGGMPKIFQADTGNIKKIVFKNEDYTNPSKVTYELLGKSTYRRSIEGTENDSLVIYTFEFKKLHD